MEHGPENKRIRTLEMVPIYLKKRIESYDDGLLDYCKNDLNLNNPRICLKKIKMQSLISLNGFKVRLSARTGNRVVLRNEVQLCLNQRWNNYIHFIEKYVKGQQISEKIDSEKNVQLYDELTNKHLNEIFAKRQNPIGEKLQNGRTKFLGLSLENQAKILFQILQLSTTGTSTADLSEIGGAPTSGKMRYNKNIVDAIECDLICQSVTGVFENRINLLKI